MKHNYLDLSDGQRIADQINEEKPDNVSVEKLVKEVTVHLKKIEEENIRYAEAGQSRETASRGKPRTVRNKERMQNTKLVLLYLSTFLSHLPVETTKESDPLNPFEQFKSLVLYNINLIKEKDVTAAILREHEKLGLLTDLNTWYYRGQINKSFKSIREDVEQAKDHTLEDYRKLFLGCQKLSSFWFSVRNQDIKRVRACDTLMYRLSRFLLEKYK